MRGNSNSETGRQTDEEKETVQDIGGTPEIQLHRN
jgi:hypothetical protein